jgi:hypothetical protein
MLETINRCFVRELIFSIESSLSRDGSSTPSYLQNHADSTDQGDVSIPEASSFPVTMNESDKSIYLGSAFALCSNKGDNSIATTSSFVTSVCYW